MIRWPAKLNPKSIDQTICLTDVAETLVQLLKLEADPLQMEDSHSFLPLLVGEAGYQRKPIIHQSGNGTLAIRKGAYKLVLSDGSGGKQFPKGIPFKRPYQLYNIKKDPYETNNLYHTEKELALQLEKELYEVVGDDISAKDFKLFGL